jgi:hypothetical protein
MTYYGSIVLVGNDTDGAVIRNVRVRAQAFSCQNSCPRMPDWSMIPGANHRPGNVSCAAISLSRNTHRDAGAFQYYPSQGSFSIENLAYKLVLARMDAVKSTGFYHQWIGCEVTEGLPAKHQPVSVIFYPLV